MHNHDNPTAPRRPLRIPWAAVAACAILAAPGARAQDPEGVASRPTLQKAKDLLGADIHAASDTDKDLGELKDLVIDLRSGQVEYAVVDFDDGKMAAVPVGELKLHPDHGLTMNAGEEQGRTFPRFEEAEWPARVTGQTGQWSPYGRLADDRQFIRASKFIGMDVENWSGEDLGDIKDLVIDLDRGVARYAVLASGGFLGMGQDDFAVRIDRFRHHKDGDNLVLAADPEDFKKARSLDEGRWPAYADEDWSDWGGQVARDDRSDRYSTSRQDPRPQNYRDDPRYRSDNRYYDDRRYDERGYEGRRSNDRYAPENEPGYRDAWQEESRRGDGRRLEEDPRRLAYPWQDQPPSDADMGDDAWQDDPRNRYDRWLQQERQRTSRDQGRGWNDDVVYRVPWYGSPQPTVFDQSYDPAKTQQVSGQVVAIQERSRSTAASEYDRSVQVKIKTDDGRHMLVHLGPAMFLDREGLAVSSGDRVEVQGSPAQVEGDQVVIAQQLTLNGNRVQLRNQQGNPVWLEPGSQRATEDPRNRARQGGQPSRNPPGNPQGGNQQGGNPQGSNKQGGG